MMTLRDWRALVMWPSLILLLAFGVIEAFSLDRPIATALYFDAARGWLGKGAGDWWARNLIHAGGGLLVRVVVAAAFAWWALSFKIARLAAWRREALYVCVAMAAATVLVGVLKWITNVDCPWDLTGFGGTRPYVALFGGRPDYLPRAQCFPGSHSSSGFALMCFYFALRDRHRVAARCALTLGAGVGLIFAFGQEARGAHFLSHDLASAILVWWVLIAIYGWMLLPRAGRP